MSIPVSHEEQQQRRIADLTRKLEEAKGALETAYKFIANEYLDVSVMSGEVFAKEARPVIAILSEAIASLSPEQPEKPEAVETGERMLVPRRPTEAMMEAAIAVVEARPDVDLGCAVGMCWEAMLSAAPTPTEQADDLGENYYFDDDAPKPEAVETGEPVARRKIMCQTCLGSGWGMSKGGACLTCGGSGRAASPVSDGEARRKALEEAAKIARTWREWLHEQPGAIGLGQAIAAQILATIPTAGDANNGQ